MKYVILTLLLSVMVALTSCDDTITKDEKIFQHGVELAQQAKDYDELIQITIDVRNQLIEAADGTVFSDDEYARYRQAQSRFYEAVDNRSYQLIGQYGIWGQVY